MTIPPPSRQEVKGRMLALLSGRRSREEVADWAAVWVCEPDPDVEDPAVWEGLISLSGADLMVAPGEYLHTEPDSHSWLDDLEAGG